MRQFIMHPARSIPSVFSVGIVLWTIAAGIAGRASWADELKEGKDSQSRLGIVVSVSQPASVIGREVLDAGGNAVDAAVATAFALAVTWPEAGNIGGGGFMLIHSPGQAQPIMIDYREKAPALATVDMFANGRTSPHLLVGVPGTVRGLQLAHNRFGRLAWEQLVLPAARLAREGFKINDELAKSLNEVIETSRGNAELLRVLGKDNGRQTWTAGDRLIQNDLAATLTSIATEGADAFYTGPLVDSLEAEMERGGGLIRRSDLAAYEPEVRAPVHGTFRGYEIFAAAPPSSGGIALIQMLNMVETFNLRQEGRWSPLTLHLMIESMRRAYLDRARFLGDPDFVDIPPHLTSKQYAAELAQSISPTTATSSAELGADILTPEDGPNTTHFSVIDRDGMAVSNTYTLENSFGSRIVVQGAGYLLNDEMGDFNPRPGVTDSRGLIGTKPNLVAPGKRMLSSMTPVIVTRNQRVVLVTGSPGGRTIINTVFCVVLNLLEFEMPIRDAVDAPRLHHAWMPDTVTLETGLLRDHPDAVASLREKGHQIVARGSRQGDAHSIYISESDGMRWGAADQRRRGWASGQ
ncbi:gamma-glutamyltransferase [Schlesneria sp. T3-172]|uniref:gamma-glutamyltransferase n=1 Tax=Schlesneria sphaerica TaxID=3373610 RepID=UPI0037C948C3